MSNSDKVKIFVGPAQTGKMGRGFVWTEPGEPLCPGTSTMVGAISSRATTMGIAAEVHRDYALASYKTRAVRGWNASSVDAEAFAVNALAEAIGLADKTPLGTLTQFCIETAE